MSLGNTVTLTVNAVAKTLNLVNEGNYSSEYVFFDTTEKFELKIRHSRDKPRKSDGVVYSRHAVEFTQTIYAVPLVSAEKVRRVYTTFLLQDGDTLNERYISDALCAWLVASTSAKTVSILNWES